MNKTDTIKEKDHNGLKLEEAFRQYIDYNVLADNFSEIQPIYYDKSKIWWLWDFKKLCWTQKDETDILIEFDKSNTIGNTCDPKIKSMILESLRRTGRKNPPREIKKTWIQFKDKIIDIENKREIEVKSNFFTTNPIPWKLGETDETPTMDKIFNEWIGEDYIKTLYEILAFCALSDYPIHRIFCFVGSGSNGKSKFLELTRKFIGSNNSCSSDLYKIVSSRFEAAKLYKKLACFLGETNFSILKDTATLKQLTGEDLIGFEFKNKNPFDGINYAKIMIATNSLPITEDKTKGFYRRWLIIDFPNEFTEKKDILEEIPDKEYENLAKKSINILNELIKNREFCKEGTLEDRKKRYEEKSDYFQRFLDEECHIGFNEEIIFQDFFTSFVIYCETNGFRKLSSNQIGRLLKGKGFVSKNKKRKKDNGEETSVNTITGLKLKDD